jgi:two-component system, chemotaxis family, protein-glutamate methylesterase/glutaminase
MAEARTTPPRRLRVLVVDDSEICRSTIVSILEADGDIEVVGEGEDGFSAFNLVESLAPDLVTMDVQMPGKSGLEAVEQIMARDPVPILVVTAESLHDGSEVAFTAIQNGALDIVSKPSITDVEAGAALRMLVRNLAAIPVFKRVDPRSLTAMPPIGAAIEIIALASGKGGIASVIGLVSRLPVQLDLPVVLYDPMPREVVASYVGHLARICRLPIRIAQSPEATCAPGELTVVTGGRASWIGPSVLRVAEGPPSALQFLRTLAEIYGGRSAGVLLRGECPEGAAGLGALRDAGGKTFTEIDLGPGGPAFTLEEIASNLRLLSR